MEETTVAQDEARQAAQRDAMKSDVGGRVNAEIAGQAAISGGGARVAEVAANLRNTAIDETVRGSRVLGHARTAARGSQFIDYGFYVVYSLLAIRFALALIGARPGSGFVRFIGVITTPFFAPFRGIVPSPTVGGFSLVLPIVIAIAVLALLHVAVNGLLRMVGHRKTEI